MLIVHWNKTKQMTIDTFQKRSSDELESFTDQLLIIMLKYKSLVNKQINEKHI